MNLLNEFVRDCSVCRPIRVFFLQRRAFKSKPLDSLRKNSSLQTETNAILILVTWYHKLDDARNQQGDSQAKSRRDSRPFVLVLAKENILCKNPARTLHLQEKGRSRF